MRPRDGIDASTPALILTAHDHNGLNQARTLGRLGVSVHVTHPPRRSAVTASRHIAGRHAWDVRTHEDADTLRFLRERVAPAIGRRAVLFAGEDRSAIFAAEHARELSDAFVVATPPGGLVRSLVGKDSLAALCLQAGVPTPATATPASDDEVAAFAGEATYPVMVKARHGWRLHGISRDVTAIVSSPGDLSDAVRRLSPGAAPDVVLQEHVGGGPGWFVSGYVDASGRVLFALSGAKLREYPVDRGLATLAVLRPNATVIDTALRFLRAVGYTGPLDMDFRIDERDGLCKLIDFNPRPGASFRTCVDVRGLDAVRATYLDLTGQPVEPGPPRTGRRWIVENWDLAAARRLVGDGRLARRDYLRSLRGVEEGAWFAHDDPAPFALMLAGLGAATGAHLARCARASRLGDRPGA
jgi:D-aspartate ligase